MPLMEEVSGLMAYLRRGRERDILVLGNFNPQELSVPAGQSMEEGQILLNNAESLDIQGGNISLKPLQAVVLGIMHKNNG